MSFGLQQNQFLSPVSLLNCQALSCIDCMIASSSVNGRSSIFLLHFRFTRMLLALEMTGEDVTSMCTKTFWMLFWVEFCLALHPAPPLKFWTCLFHASRPLSDQTPMGFPSKILKNPQLCANIWCTEGLICTQGKFKAM